MKFLRRVLGGFRSKASPAALAGKPKIQHPFSALPFQPEEVSLVIDAGAFLGHYTVAAATSYPRSRIIAFEPTQESAAQFLVNTAAYSDRVKLHPVGLSDVPGEGVIHLTTTGGANSVQEQTQEHQRQNPHVRECGRQKIVLRTLDDCLHDTPGVIDVLKVDVEGLELKVLRGATATLARTRFVILEVALSRDEDVRYQSVFELFAFLRQAHFHLYSLLDVYRFDEPQPSLGMAQFDAIFCHHDL